MKLARNYLALYCKETVLLCISFILNYLASSHKKTFSELHGFTRVGKEGGRRGKGGWGDGLWHVGVLVLGFKKLSLLFGRARRKLKHSMGGKN